MNIPDMLILRWRRVMTRYARVPVVGSLATRLASVGLPPLYGAVPLSRIRDHGFVSHRARLAHPGLTLGDRCFIGDGVLIYQDQGGAGVTLGTEVHLHENSSIQTGVGGSVSIGNATHIQPRCQISAYCGDVEIGERVEIAPSCAFYPYNHRMDLEMPIRDQPLYTRSGGILVGDDAWLGFGVILLDGASVGNGAVVAAGAVVNSSIPENAIAAGSPARVVGTRS